MSAGQTIQFVEAFNGEIFVFSNNGANNFITRMQTSGSVLQTISLPGSASQKFLHVAQVGIPIDYTYVRLIVHTNYYYSVLETSASGLASLAGLSKQVSYPTDEINAFHYDKDSDICFFSTKNYFISGYTDCDNTMTVAFKWTYPLLMGDPNL